MVTLSRGGGVKGEARGLTMAYFRYHLFFCTNRREDGSPCCAQCGAQEMRDYFKARTKALGIAGPGGVRVNTAGCLDRCAEGPVLVVYPEGTWYTYVDREDMDEILAEHLLGGRVVERLLLPAEISRGPSPPNAKKGLDRAE
jgi:(2Fe-2S) ferredoxin